MAKNSKFGTFLKSFGEGWLLRMSGPPSVPLMVAGYFIPSHLHSLKLGLFGLGLTAGIVSSYTIWKKERDAVIQLEDKLNPLLVLECNSITNPACVSASVAEYKGHGNSPPFTRNTATFFRMVVSVNPPNVVSGCRAWVLSIKHNGEELLQADKLEFNFTHCSDDEKYSKTVVNSVPDFVDILRIEESEDLIQQGRDKAVVKLPARSIPNSLDLAKMFATHDTYVFSVVVAGESGISSEAKLKFVWGGDVASSSLTKI